jgi:hypothetical protein
MSPTHHGDFPTGIYGKTRNPEGCLHGGRHGAAVSQNLTRRLPGLQFQARLVAQASCNYQWRRRSRQVPIRLFDLLQSEQH